jgi:hypothetical protein
MKGRCKKQLPALATPPHLVQAQFVGSEVFHQHENKNATPFGVAKSFLSLSTKDRGWRDSNSQPHGS